MSWAHTHGPWMASVDESTDIWQIDSEGHAVATTLFCFAGEKEANARLMAAAPDMLAALALFERQWNACGPNSDFGRFFQNVRDDAVAAIAKATGK